MDTRFSKNGIRTLLIILVFLFVLAVPMAALAEPETTAEPETDAQQETEAAPSVPEAHYYDISEGLTDDMFKSASVVMLFDAETGEEIYSKNSDKRVFPASTTKLLTALIAEEDGLQDRNVTVKVCADDFSSDNSLMGLVRNETISGLDLMYGMLVRSGNDAASAIAVEIAGSGSEFAELMNQKAAELGMTHSHFVNASGLHNDDHYTTGADMKKLAMEAHKSDLLMKICGTGKYIVDPTDMCIEQRTLFNSNKLLITSNPLVDTDYTYEYATGMKTGATSIAQACVVASAKKDNQEYIALIFDDSSESGANRWLMCHALFDYAFENYRKIDPSQYIEDCTINERVRNTASNDPGEGMAEFKADVSELGSGILVTADEFDALENGSAKVTTNITLNTIISAPLFEGQKVGNVEYYIDGETVGNVPLVSTRRVYTKGEEEIVPLIEPAETDEDSEETARPDIAEHFHNKNILMLLIIPAGIIAFIIIRAAVMSKARSRMRRGAPITGSLDKDMPPNRTARHRKR